MYEGAIQNLIDELGRLPGVGPKSAQRIAFHILQTENTDIARLVESIRELKRKLFSVLHAAMLLKKNSVGSVAIHVATQLQFA